MKIQVTPADLGFDLKHGRGKDGVKLETDSEHLIQTIAKLELMATKLRKISEAELDG